MTADELRALLRDELRPAIDEVFAERDALVEECAVLRHEIETLKGRIVQLHAAAAWKARPA